MLFFKFKVFIFVVEFFIIIDGVYIFDIGISRFLRFLYFKGFYVSLLLFYCKVKVIIIENVLDILFKLLMERRFREFVILVWMEGWIFLRSFGIVLFSIRLL